MGVRKPPPKRVTYINCRVLYLIASFAAFLGCLPRQGQALLFSKRITCLIFGNCLVCRRTKNSLGFLESAITTLVDRSLVPPSSCTQSFCPPDPDRTSPGVYFQPMRSYKLVFRSGIVCRRIHSFSISPHTAKRRMLRKMHRR